jgi:hypothetical protein
VCYCCCVLLFVVCLCLSNITMPIRHLCSFGSLLLQFRNTLFLGATRQYLIELHDPDHGNLFSKISAIIVPLGFIFVPIVSWVVDTRGLMVAAHLTNVLGLLYGGLTCIPVLWVQPIATFFFAFWRVVLFTAISTFTAAVFGAKSIGRISGVLYTSTAFLIILQAPLVKFSTDQVILSSCHPVIPSSCHPVILALAWSYTACVHCLV